MPILMTNTNTGFFESLQNDHGVYVIAEAGVNHNGDMALARQLIDAAKQSGASAVKFQLFDPEALTSKVSPMAAYQEQNTGESTSQLEMLRKLALSPEQFRELAEYCQQVGITFLCTPFDEASARYLVETLQVPLLKIPSGEITNLPFLAFVAKLNVPLIISTGMATLQEVQEAVDTIYTANADSALAILHCVSAYPAPDEAINLRAMATIKSTFPDCPVGYSDHTAGISISLAAVALGATIIEKHFTLDKSLPGPDHQASLSIEELTQLIEEVQRVSDALGDGVKRPHAVEQDCIQVVRKSLVVRHDLPVGHELTAEDIVIKRPGTGISPKHLDAVIGQRLSQSVTADTVLMPSNIDGFSDLQR